MASTITHDRRNCLVYSLLKAMEEPIKKGERYLGYWFSDNSIQEHTANQDNKEPYHPVMLRLPSQFQPSREMCERKCCDCKCEYCTKPDPVEERLKSISWKIWKNAFTGPKDTQDAIVRELRELVELASKTK